MEFGYVSFIVFFLLNFERYCNIECWLFNINISRLCEYFYWLYYWNIVGSKVVKILKFIFM